MPEATLIQRPKVSAPAISVIGMAGSGKTTIGRMLARLLGWAFMDTDQLIESVYATRLQNITDALSRDEFLDLEQSVITSVRASRCVISTGGSSVYREGSMRYLQGLGPVVCLDAPFPVIRDRIALHPDRGLVIAEGQTLEGLYNERKVLYDRYGTMHCDATRPPEECAEWIRAHLPPGVLGKVADS